MPLQEESKNDEFFLLSVLASMAVFQVVDKSVCGAVGILLAHLKCTSGWFRKIKVGKSLVRSLWEFKDLMQC